MTRLSLNCFHHRTDGCGIEIENLWMDTWTKSPQAWIWRPLLFLQDSAPWHWKRLLRTQSMLKEIKRSKKQIAQWLHKRTASKWLLKRGGENQTVLDQKTKYNFSSVSNDCKCVCVGPSTHRKRCGLQTPWAIPSFRKKKSYLCV